MMFNAKQSYVTTKSMPNFAPGLKKTSKASVPASSKYKDPKSGYACYIKLKQNYN